MDCSDVKELLSAYHDDELPSDKRAAVAQHLEGCEPCAQELEGFRSLSAIAESLTHPEPPARLWQQLEEHLDVEPGKRADLPPSFPWLQWTRKPAVRFGLATAAAILIVVGALGYRTWLQHGDDTQFVSAFGQYVNEFQRDPDAAQQILLAKYQGRAVDAEQAIHAVGYRPAVAGGMPEGYAVDSTYVMQLPCCTCVQCVCTRADGTTIAIFEHDDEEPHWFGDRAVTEAACGGQQCRMVTLDNRLAATWQHGTRHITVVGARDKEEVGELVAWFDERR